MEIWSICVISSKLNYSYAGLTRLGLGLCLGLVIKYSLYKLFRYTLPSLPRRLWRLDLEPHHFSERSCTTASDV